VLRGEHRDYVINEVAVAYWQKNELSAGTIASLAEGPTHFVDAAAWNARLQALAITGARLARITTEERCWAA